MLSGRGLCDGPILRTEESYREKESVIVKVYLCVIDSYQMQQSSSKRVSRSQTKEERKLNASVVRSNKLEQAMMLLTCIRAVVVSNQNCSTDLPTDVLHSA